MNIYVKKFIIHQIFNESLKYDLRLDSKESQHLSHIYIRLSNIFVAVYFYFLF